MLRPYSASTELDRHFSKAVLKAETDGRTDGRTGEQRIAGKNKALYTFPLVETTNVPVNRPTDAVT